jgi:serine/threonine-protein kinase
MTGASTRSGECPALAELEAVAAGATVELDLSAHLETCPECRERLAEVRANNEMLVRLSNAGLSDGPAAGPPEDATMETIPGYEVIEELHRGGQGVVYKARQLATKRVAALSHPGIVTVYDSGVTPGGRHWFAMEFVDGRPLDDHLRDRRAVLSLRDLLGLFETVCSAVAYAHQRGVIHRDLKPGNILVDERGRPRVVDFGLAKPVDPEVAPEAATVTVAGGFLGTLAYASPEQAAGDPNAVDVRSDVYCLGVILYEMLCGEYPYDVSGALSGILDAIRTTQPRPLRGRGPYRVDDELETICLKTLAKDPARRYQSAEALGRDVRNYLAGAPIDAKRDSGWYLLTKTMARHKVKVGAVAAFVLLLAAASLSLWISNQRVRAQARKVSEINIFLEDTLGSVASSTGRGEITLRETLDEGVQWVDLALGHDPEIEAAVRVIIGNGYRNLGLEAEADRELTLALAASRELGERHLQTSKALSSLALLRRDQGRFEDAETLLQEALAIRRHEFGDDHLETALVRANLAEVAFRDGRIPEAQSVMQRVLAVRSRQRGEDHPDVAMCLYNIGRYRESAGDLEGALELHERALALRRRALRPAHPDLSRSLVAAARLHLQRGAPDEARPLLEECLAIRRGAGRPIRWQIAEVEGLLGACLVVQQRYPEAEPLLLAALENGLAGTRPEARDRLVQLYEDWGRPDDAAHWRETGP